MGQHSAVNPARARQLVHRADAVTCELEQQQRLWNKGFTRRRFLAGAGMVGVAALSSQLVTTKAAFGVNPGGNTVIFMFLRGGGDGLRMVVPTSDATYLNHVRPALYGSMARTAIASGNSATWAVNSKLAPLLSLSNCNVRFVPGVSSGDASRSHFQAQALLETGGNTASTSGWLDRALPQLGQGTTFRAMTMGSAAPQSMTGDEPDLVMNSLSDFRFPAGDDDWGKRLQASSESAIETLYRGVTGPLGESVPITFDALTKARAASALAPAKAADYKDTGGLGNSLQDLAKLIKQQVGLQVATVDVGGWDTHTSEVNDLDQNLTTVTKALKAFFTDLGAAAATTTVVVMTEFGRRVAQNGTGGTDHGHGQVMWLLGAGVPSTRVVGNWTPLSDGALDQGDVPTCNHAFDVLGEVLQKRLSVTPDSSVFYNHSYASVGALQ